MNVKYLKSRIFGSVKSIAFFSRSSWTGLLCVPVLCTVLVTNEALINEPTSAKYFWFYGSMGLVALTFVLLAVVGRKRWRPCGVDGWVAVFGVVSLVGSYIHTGAVDTKWVLLLLCMVLYFCLRIVLAGNRVTRYVLMLVLLVTALVEEVWGLLQLYGVCASQHNLFLTTGSFFNPGPYAGYLAVVVPPALYYVCTDYRVFRRHFGLRLLCFYVRWCVSALVLAGALLVLPAAMSRAAWLAVLAGVALTAWQLARRTGRWKTYVGLHRHRLLWGGCLVVVGLLAAGAGMYYMKKDSADGRWLIWKVAAGAVPEHPWGVGLNRFSGAYGEAQAAYFAAGAGTAQERRVAGAPEYAFNEYVQMGMELGVVSLLLFAGMAVSVCMACMRRGLPQADGRVAVAGAWVSLLVFAAMSYPFSVLPFVILLVFLAAFAVPELPMQRSWPVWPLSLAALVLTGWCLYDRYPTYAAYRGWEAVKPLYSMGYYDDGLEQEYTRLYPYLNDRVQFLFEYGQVLNRAGHYEQSNAVLAEACRISCDPMLYNVMGRNSQALKHYDEAEAAYVKSSCLVPSRHYPYYLLAKLYMEQGDTARAKAMAEYVIAKDPKVPSRAIEEMKEEMKEMARQ